MHLRVHGLDYREAGLLLGIDAAPRCPVCDRSFSGPRGLERHLWMTHDYSRVDAADAAGISRQTEMPTRSGIYFFRHPTSHRVYVGQAVDLDRRIAGHLADLEARRHVNLLLQLDYELLQEQGLTLESGVLAECSQQELDVRERELIETHDALRHGYNLAKVGSRGPVGAKRAELEEARLTLCERWSGVSRELYDQLTHSLRGALEHNRCPFEEPHSSRLREDILENVAEECGIEPRQVTDFHRAAWSLDLSGLRLISEQASYRTMLGG